jgi:oxygen-independent coproporphyrinogen-3 oxidase
LGNARLGDAPLGCHAEGVREGASPLAVSSLYLHVPFCAQKCEYCAFYSTAAEGELVNRYVAALTRELEMRREAIVSPPRTVFFGGGTPSLLNLRQWTTVLTAFERLGLLGAREWTVECNPATVSPDKAKLLRDYGVNRISMGVQSLDDGLLDRLGRVHTREMVFRSYDILRAAGFENINIDLMFAIPGQTLDSWKATLREAVALHTEHLSCYEVIYEEDTPLFAQLQAGEIDIDEDLAAAMYDALLNEAEAAGFRQYEVANFARDRRQANVTPEDHETDSGTDLPTYACRHNVNYWRGGPYAGLGPSACGFERGKRYGNVANTRIYCECVESGRSPRAWNEELPSLARAGEIAAFGLRMNAGWQLSTFKAATGFDLQDEWRQEIQSLIERGWARLDQDRFHLTPAGMRFADAAGSEFLRT